ncbi:MAG TPA: hypothetical protein QGF05_12385 [Dehalococcoidia bacterium]|nr:hypothetical protein [Dehalococcoidia bacterium]
MRSTTLTLSIRPLLVLFVAAALILGIFLAATPVLEASDLAEPVTEQVISSPIDSDVQDDGLNGFGASDWVMFAVLLAPFLVLFTGIMWLTFGIDKSEGRE